MEIITKQEAEARGLRFYTSGKKCRHQHECPRYTKNNQCVKCAARRYVRRPEKVMPASIAKQEQIEKYKKLGARLILGHCDGGSE